MDLARLKQLAGLAVAGESAMRSGEWMHHYLIEAVGAAGFLYEIAMYWPDERHAFHARMVDKDYLAKMTTFPANPEALGF